MTYYVHFNHSEWCGHPCASAFWMLWLQTWATKPMATQSYSKAIVFTGVWYAQHCEICVYCLSPPHPHQAHTRISTTYSKDIMFYLVPCSLFLEYCLADNSHFINISIIKILFVHIDWIKLKLPGRFEWVSCTSLSGKGQPKFILPKLVFGFPEMIKNPPFPALP